jgi:hypothetical protein
MHRNLVVLCSADDYKGRICSTDVSIGAVRTNNLEELREHWFPTVSGYVILVTVVFNVADTTVVHPVAIFVNLCTRDDKNSTMSEHTDVFRITMPFMY